MSKLRLVLVATMALSLSAATLSAAEPAAGKAADASMDALVNSIRSNRKAMVAVNLNLTDDEATKFWPIYDRYQKEMQEIGDRMMAVVEDYSKNFNDLTDEKATKLMDDYLATEADRAKVKRAYVEEFSKALPGRKMARFYQIDNKMDAVIRYELAAAIPVVDEEKSPPTK